MKCKHCNTEMLKDENNIYLSNPPQYKYTCPRCGSIEYGYEYSFKDTKPVPLGWVCPKCGAVMSPDQKVCPYFPYDKNRYSMLEFNKEDKLEEDYKSCYNDLRIKMGYINELNEIITQFKQFQNSKAIEELEQLRRDIWADQQDDGWLDEKVDLYYLSETIDNKIKELGGGENE